MKIEISITDTAATIEALDAAIDVMTHARDNGQMSFQYATDSITELQMMKVAYMLAQRNAAKEQRKGRANDTMAMLPNDYHPSQRCSCGSCLTQHS